MTSGTYKKRPPPSEAARLAAVAKRRDTAKIVKDKARPDVFVVRREAPSRTFGWEIRRFGSVVLEASTSDFTSAEEAGTAGQAALALRLSGS